MKKPKEIIQFEAVFYVELQENSLEEVQKWDKRNSFALDTEGKVISVNLRLNQILNLEPLKHLPYLQSLGLSNNQLLKIEPLQHLTNLQLLDLSYNQISNIEPLQHLTKLQWLDLRYNPISSLEPLQHLTKLQWLDLRLIQISNIEPLQHLVELQTLDLSSNQISDLAPLQHLSSLQELDLSLNKISDLAPLQYLSSLQELKLRENDISDLAPLQHLSNLQSLVLSDNRITDLTPLKSLSNLRTLYLGVNRITDLTPLQSLSNLRTLYLSFNQLSNLEPLRHLSNLQRLDLRYSRILEIAPLQKLANLQSLDLSGNYISNLASLKCLKNLQELDLSYTKVKQINLPFLNYFEQLKELKLAGDIYNIPKEIYDKIGNVLPQVRHYLEDLENGRHPNRDVKIVFIGNGNVGKTQIARRLALGKDFVFEEQHDSTHGIVQLAHQLETGDPEIDSLNLQLWDFAGQDIYHATHRLFMQTKAVFVLVWDVENEQAPYHTFQGKRYKNEKLRYWLEYAKCFGKGSPVLLVQNKIDRKKDAEHKLLKELEAEYRDAYPISEVIRVSAKTGKGILLLEECLASAFTRDEEIRQQLLIDLPVAWVNVRTALRNRQADGEKELSLESFKKICEGFEVRRSAATILQFFHDTGELYYRKNYFQNRILLDQSWAIHAIYQVLDRSSHYYEILEHHQGQLNYQRLCKVWPEHSNKERELFIDFMLSCELCFETTEDKKHNTPLTERTFTIPQLLPSQRPAEVDFQLQRRPLSELHTLEFRFLPKVFLQRFIVQAYRLAEPQHIWQQGILLVKGKGRALVEADYEQRCIRIRYNPEGALLRDKIMDKLKAIEGEGQVKPKDKKRGKDWEMENLLFWSGSWKTTAEAGAPDTQQGPDSWGEETHADLLQKKLNFLRRELVLAYDAEKKFALHQQIEWLEGELKRLLNTGAD